MPRTFWALPALILLAAGALPARAAEADLNGNWKLVLLTPERPTFWLVALETKEGKLTGSVLDSRPRLPMATIKDVADADGKFTLTFEIRSPQGSRELKFDGVLPKEAGKPIRGTIELDSLVLAQFEPTKAKTYAEIQFDVNKAVLAGAAEDQRFFDAFSEILPKLAKEKVKPEEVKAWAEKANKSAEGFGPRFHKDMVMKIAEALVNQEGYADVALPYAQLAEKMLDPKASGVDQLKVLNLLAAALKKANKPDELKAIEARIEKIDLSVATTKFPGRKGKSERVVLVELFTCAECQGCLSPERAFEGLLKTYAPGEVVFLKYHLHTPGPDPLTNEDGETRNTFYGKAAEDTPALLINGEAVGDIKGASEDAPDLYKGIRDILDGAVEKESKATLKLTAAKKGNKIDISADVADLQEPGSQVKLRFVLVEDEVAYKGNNMLKKHANVVRAFPGGVNGVAVKTKTFNHTASIDLDMLRKDLTKYLDDQAKNTPFPNKERPLELKNLKVIALLQNDKTKEVLQTAQVDVKE